MRNQPLLRISDPSGGHLAPNRQTSKIYYVNNSAVNSSFVSGRASIGGTPGVPGGQQGKIPMRDVAEDLFFMNGQPIPPLNLQKMQ